MRINFSKLSAVMTVFFLLSSHALADDNTYLVVKSATSQSYDLASVKDITFSDDGISVNLVNGKSVPFAYSSFDELRFELSTPTAVEGIATKGTPGVVEVFDLQGRKVASFVYSDKTFRSLSLPTGVYIVRSGGKSFKVINR